MAKATEQVSSSVANVRLFTWNCILHDATYRMQKDDTVILAFRMNDHDHDRDDPANEEPSSSSSSSSGVADSFETYVTDFANFSDYDRVFAVIKLALRSKASFRGKTLHELTCQIFQHLSCNFHVSCLRFEESTSPLVVLVDINRRFQEGQELCSSSCFSQDQDHIVKSLRESLKARKIFAKGIKSSELEEVRSETISEIIVGHRNEEEGDSCSICLEGYPKEGQVAFRTVCNHIFHGDCIMRSCMSRRGTCPLCRATLPIVCVFHGFKFTHEDLDLLYLQ